ncbi:MAG: hypothetical protein QXO22_08230 [Thermosphaera sp.]
MKASIPIIIASILFTALIVSTLFYATASTTLMLKRYDTYSREVEHAKNELAGVILVALRNAAYEADRVFNGNFTMMWQDPVSGEHFRDGNFVNREYRGKSGCKIEVWLYNYDDHSKNCGTNERCDYSTNYSDYNLIGFNKSRDNFKSIVEKASVLAGNVYRAYLQSALAAWSSVRKNLGYTIDYFGDVVYSITVNHSPSTGSYTTTNLTAYVSAEIYHPSIGLMRVNTTVSIIVNASFYRGWRDYDSSYIPINITTKIYRDGVETTYLLSPGDVEMKLQSKIFNRLNTSLPVSSGGTVSSSLTSLHYLANGLSQAVFKITTNPGKNTYSLVLEVIRGFSLADATSMTSCSEPPRNATESTIDRDTVKRHVLVFFVAGNIRVFVDRVWIHAPLIMVFKHYYYANVSENRWESRRVFVLYGDPAIPPPS